MLLEWNKPDYLPETRERSVMMKKVRICCRTIELRKITNFREFAQQCEYFTDVASNYKSDL